MTHSPRLWKCNLIALYCSTEEERDEFLLLKIIITHDIHVHKEYTKQQNKKRKERSGKKGQKKSGRCGHRRNRKVSEVRGWL